MLTQRLGIFAKEQIKNECLTAIKEFKENQNNAPAIINEFMSKFGRK